MGIYDKIMRMVTRPLNEAMRVDVATPQMMEDAELYEVTESNDGSRYVRLIGYCYDCGDGPRIVEYSYPEIELREFISELSKYPDYQAFIDEYQETGKTYIGEPTDEEYEEHLRSLADKVNSGKLRALAFDEITEHTPAGQYFA